MVEIRKCTALFVWLLPISCEFSNRNHKMLRIRNLSRTRSNRLHLQRFLAESWALWIFQTATQRMASAVSTIQAIVGSWPVDAPLCAVKVKSTEAVCVLKENRGGLSAHVVASQPLTKLSWFTINVIKWVLSYDMNDGIITILRISEEFYSEMGHLPVVWLCCLTRAWWWSQSFSSHEHVLLCQHPHHLFGEKTASNMSVVTSPILSCD